MSESTPTESSASDSSSTDSSSSFLSKRAQTLIGTIILGLTIVMILFSGSRGLGEEEAKKLLANFDAYITQAATQHGKTASFTYGPVQTEGWGYDKKAAVTEVSIELVEKGPVDSKKLSLSTERVVLGKDNSLYERVYAKFLSPINVIHDSHLAYIVNSEDPITYSTHRKTHDGASLLMHGIRLPKEVVVNSALVAGQKEDNQERTVLNVAQGNNIWLEVDQASGKKHLSYHLPEILMTHGGNALLSAADMSGVYTVVAGEENKASGEFEFKFSDLVLNADAKDKPFSAVFEGTYTDATMQMDYIAMRPRIEDIAVELNKAAVMGEDFSIVSVGSVTLAADDPLPHGMLDIEIVNADNLISDDIIPSALKGFLEAALKRASGTEYMFAERISIPVKREKNGVLYLGGSTFEEITAAVLADFLKSAAGGKDRPAEVARDLPPLPEGAPTLEALEDTSEEQVDEAKLPGGETLGSVLKEAAEKEKQELTVPLAGE